jgi:hypothetical protein
LYLLQQRRLLGAWHTADQLRAIGIVVFAGFM